MERTPYREKNTTFRRTVDLYPEMTFPESIRHVVRPDNILTLRYRILIVTVFNIFIGRSCIRKMYRWATASPIEVISFVIGYIFCRINQLLISSYAVGLDCRKPLISVA